MSCDTVHCSLYPIGKFADSVKDTDSHVICGSIQSVALNLELFRDDAFDYIIIDTAGVGDRHVDLFWAVWSLQFNLKTDKYRERFLDAYGRDRMEPEMLRLIAACEVFL